MSRHILFFVALAFAATAPLLRRNTAPASSRDFPGWPAEFDGATLTRMPATKQDEFFTRDFPGRVARFAAGDAQVVVRWVNAPTRRLHPAAHCFAGAGYSLDPRPMRHDAHGGLMNCFAASRGGEALHVCEQLRDAAGVSWPDVSAWYWHAAAAPAGSSWWSYVIVEREPPAPGS
jgi:hypothetical protein